MKFSKMHGCGNDYVYIDTFNKKVENPSELSVKVSNRHFGIGSDGLILIRPSDKADCFMEMYNADGSRSAMCGNGIRCVAKYLLDHHMTEASEGDEITVDTLAGIKTLRIIKNGKIGEEAFIRVNMGRPIVDPLLVPVDRRYFDNKTDKDEHEAIISEELTIDGRTYRMTCVSMGNPHAVTFVEDTKSIDIEKIGPMFEYSKAFPERVNTEFIQILSDKEVNMRVWERGSGETFACGTGACAAAYACMLNGYTGKEVTVHLLGGDLQIRYDEEENVIYMTGPALTVYEGEIVGITR